MLSLVPSALVAATYVAYESKLKPKLITGELLVKALFFAAITHVVMWVYRRYFLENFDTHGPVCENGYKRQTDPANPQQTTCVPVGRQTYPVVVGFGQIPVPHE